MNHRSTISSMALKGIALLTALLSGGLAKAQKEVITFDVGSFAVTVLSEGQQQGSSGILVGATEEMRKQAIPNGTFPNAVNAFLVETGTKTILFDAGYGRKLSGNLKAYGKTAEQVDVIILTHMHGDHIGGLLHNGKKTFPSATLYIPQPEHDHWVSNKSGQANAVIDAYKEHLHLFTPGGTEDTTSLLPGIRPIAAYGHTPGHTGYMLESNGEKLFIWGDLTHAMAIQMPYPEVAVTYDSDPVQAVKSRQHLLKYLSEHPIRIAGMHISFPAIGNVVRNEANGYNFTPICECEGR